LRIHQLSKVRKPSCIVITRKILVNRILRRLFSNICLSLECKLLLLKPKILLYRSSFYQRLLSIELLLYHHILALGRLALVELAICLVKSTGELLLLLEVVALISEVSSTFLVVKPVHLPARIAIVTLISLRNARGLRLIVLCVLRVSHGNSSCLICKAKVASTIH
jgi:hypothetical protein